MIWVKTRYNVTDLISSLLKSIQNLNRKHPEDCCCNCNDWEPENLKRGIFGTHPHQVLTLLSRAAFSFPKTVCFEIHPGG